MIKNFFQNLNSYKARYIVISGQASVIYGAATFSEDIDLWVEPTKNNWGKLVQVLLLEKAEVYKLTPPINSKYINRGHGFHFTLPDSLPCFLDIMGVVPRLKSFKRSWENVNFTKTDWGNIPVMGLRDLVEIKKTQRLGDYPIISNLVQKEYEKFSAANIDKKDMAWILFNSYEIDDIIYYIKNSRIAYEIAIKSGCSYLLDCINVLKKPSQKEKYFKSASLKIAQEIEKLRQKDRYYWRPIIRELKILNKTNQLLPVGTPVIHWMN